MSKGQHQVISKFKLTLVLIVISAGIFLGPFLPARRSRGNLMEAIGLNYFETVGVLFAALMVIVIPFVIYLQVHAKLSYNPVTGILKVGRQKVLTSQVDILEHEIITNQQTGVKYNVLIAKSPGNNIVEIMPFIVYRLKEDKYALIVQAINDMHLIPQTYQSPTGFSQQYPFRKTIGKQEALTLLASSRTKEN